MITINLVRLTHGGTRKCTVWAHHTIWAYCTEGANCCCKLAPNYDLRKVAAGAPYLIYLGCKYIDSLPKDDVWESYQTFPTADPDSNEDLKSALSTAISAYLKDPTWKTA